MRAHVIHWRKSETGGNVLSGGQDRIPHPHSHTHPLTHTPALLHVHQQVQDRVGIVNDVFALASAGYCSTTHALELLSYYKGEDDTTVWTDIVKNLANLASVMYKEDQVCVCVYAACVCVWGLGV